MPYMYFKSLEQVLCIFKINFINIIYEYADNKDVFWVIDTL